MSRERLWGVAAGCRQLSSSPLEQYNYRAQIWQVVAATTGAATMEPGALDRSAMAALVVSLVAGAAVSSPPGAGELGHRRGRCKTWLL